VSSQFLSFVEIAISVSSAAAGAAAGSLAVYFSTRKPQTDSEAEDKASAKVVAPSKISIPREHLEKSKRDLRTLTLEKELVSAALTRLYEAEAAKEITRDERELLGAKYKTELKTLDEKIAKIDAFIQIGDLETLRNQLIQLVDQKMGAIEKRIETTKQIAEPLIAEMLNRAPAQKVPAKPAEEKPKVPDISDLLQRPETPLSVVPNTSEQQPTIPRIEPIAPMVQQNFTTRKSGEKVEELQKELLEALDRLEKLDVET
jgi:hypothetical protein